MIEARAVEEDAGPVANLEPRDRFRSERGAQIFVSYKTDIPVCQVNAMNLIFVDSNPVVQRCISLLLLFR